MIHALLDTNVIIEFALKWYDKVISEFPRSEVTRSTYIGKMRTLLSWREFHKELMDIPDNLGGNLIASAIFSYLYWTTC